MKKINFLNFSKKSDMFFGILTIVFFAFLCLAIKEYSIHANFVDGAVLNNIHAQETHGEYIIYFLLAMCVSGFTMLFAFFVAINDLKKMREKLKNSYDLNSKTIHALEASKDGIAVVNSQGIYTYVNQSYVLSHGYKNASDILGKSWKGFLLFQEKDFLNKNIDNYLKKHGWWFGVGTGISKNHMEFKVQISLSYLEDGGMVFVTRDITKDMDAQNYLETIKQAVEAASDGIAITDRNNQILFINKSFVKIHGIDPGHKNSLVGTDWRYIYNKKGQEHINSVVLPSTLIKGSWSGYLDVMRKDGEMFYADASLTRLENGHILGVMRDVSERKFIEEEKEKLKEQMFYAQKMEAMTRLINGMGGDFKSALGIIKSRAKLAITNENIPDDRRKHMNDIISASEKAEDMVNQIMSFSHGRNVNVSPMNVVDCILIVGNNLTKFYTKKIRCVTDVRLDQAFVFSNSVEMEKIIFGLCENAIHSIKHDLGVVTIGLDLSLNNPVSVQDDLVMEMDGANNNEKIPRIRSKGRKDYLINGSLSSSKKYLRISVIDNGSGILPEILPNIFDPFFTTKKDGGPAGLGLSYIQSFVLAAGGAIIVETEVGIGTSIHLYFPQYIKQEEILDNLKTNMN